jgi:hypothetical protein
MSETILLRILWPVISLASRPVSMLVLRSDRKEQNRTGEGEYIRRRSNNSPEHKQSTTPDAFRFAPPETAGAQNCPSPDPSDWVPIFGQKSPSSLFVPKATDATLRNRDGQEGQERQEEQGQEGNPAYWLLMVSRHPLYGLCLQFLPMENKDC